MDKELTHLSTFSIDYEMTQSRLLSPFLEYIEKKKYSYKKVSEKTKIKKSRLKKLFIGTEYLTLEDLFKLQLGLRVVVQPPKLLSFKKHYKKFYKAS